MTNKSNTDSFSPGYCEYLVPAKADKKIIITRIVSLIIGAVLIGAFFGLLMKIPQVLFLWMVVVIGVEIILFRKTKREFEYTVATGTLTVDVIYGKSFRKKVAEVRISDVEYVKYVGDGATAVSGIGAAKVIHACDKNDRDMYMLYSPASNGSDAAVIYFSGCKKLIDCIKYYNRTCVTERKD